VKPILKHKNENFVIGLTFDVTVIYVIFQMMKDALLKNIKIIL